MAALSRVLSCLLSCLALWADPALAACEEGRTVRQAERELWRDGALLAREQVMIPDQLPAAWRDESLRLRYRVDVSACAEVPNAALWLFRVGGPYRLRVDGEPLLPTLPPMPREAVAARAVLNGRTPSLVSLPVGSRSVEIEIVSLPYLRSGIARAEFGPGERLLPRHADAFAHLPGINDAVSVVALVVAPLAFAAWWWRRQRRQVLWFALCCLAWGLRGLFYADTPLPLPPLLFEQLVPLLTMLASLLLAASTLESIQALGPRRLRIGLSLLLIGLAGFALAGLLGRGALPARAYGFLTGLVLTPWLMLCLWQARAHFGRVQAVVLIGGYGLALGGALHDIAMVLGWTAPDRMSYLLPGFAALLCCTAVLLADYAIRQLDRAERANEELERRVADKSQALEHSYAERREFERSAVRHEERERLLREMHDGLGGQLMTVLRGVERGAMPREQVLAALQDSLDDLRLLMDSADTERPLAEALAAWRSRWEPRLSSLGIALVWEVDEALDPLLLPPDVTLNLMRIVQEATVNIVKHARASEMSLTAGRDAQARVWLRIRDNGVGLASPVPAGTGRRGLVNMAARARQIGADLSVAAAQDGAGVLVALRLAADGAAADASADQPTSPRRDASSAASAREEMPSLR